MNFNTIVLIDDLFRESFAPAKRFFYDLIREPIRQASGLAIRDSPRDGLASNLLSGFDSRKFITLGRGQPPLDWNETYNLLLPAADEYLLRHIPSNSLIISYEAPPWLARFCEAHNFALLDVRIAPLRFARDLCIALKSKSTLLAPRLAGWCIEQEEFKLESCFVQASVRHLRRYSPENRKYDNSLIILGQTPDDASLIGGDGKFLKVESFPKDWTALCENKRLYYKSHPCASESADSDKRQLEEIVGQDIEYMRENIYTMLGSDDDVTFAGISSGVLQEARYFGKKSHTLFRHICPLIYDEPAGYQLVAFADFVSPLFWRDLLSAAPASPKPLRLKGSEANKLRQLHDVWWGYSEHLIKDRHFFRDAFNLSGGYILNDRLSNMEASFNMMRHDLEKIQSGVASLAQATSHQITEAQQSLDEISKQLKLLRPILVIYRFFSHIKRWLRGAVP